MRTKAPARWTFRGWEEVIETYNRMATHLLWEELVTLHSKMAEIHAILERRTKGAEE